jgi:hypothetical protein
MRATMSTNRRAGIGTRRTGAFHGDRDAGVVLKGNDLVSSADAAVADSTSMHAAGSNGGSSGVLGGIGKQTGRPLCPSPPAGSISPASQRRKITGRSHARGV